jgi:hypothetical protein
LALFCPAAAAAEEHIGAGGYLLRLNLSSLIIILFSTVLVAGADGATGLLPATDSLLKANVPASPLNYDQMINPHSKSVVSHFQGEIILSPLANKNFYAFADRPGLVDAPTAAFNLPDISFQFVQNAQNEIIPIKRSLNLAEHANWDYFIGVGHIGQDQDDPSYYRIVLPLALVEKNQNCVHNGIVSFLINDLAKPSHFYYQFSSETCAYFKPDLWGMGKLSYVPMTLSQSPKVLSDYQQEKQRRLPTESIFALAKRFEQLDVDNLALNKLIKKEDMSVFGVLYQGVNYLSKCHTRAGNYPFCEAMILPSYSTAKSIFAGLTMLYLQRSYPSIFNESVEHWVPECQGQDWQGVSFADLLNMRSGHYDSREDGVDENAPKLLTFFNAQSHQDKIRFSCQAYPRQSSPGSQFVYHTSDTYLLGTALNQFVKANLGQDKDIFADVFLQKVLGNLSLSPIIERSRTTTDAAHQAFFGYGLFFTVDDIAKISQFANQQTELAIGRSMLSSGQRTTTVNGNGGIQPVSPSLAYQNGFWARDIAPLLHCLQPSWQTFMSGYGGITVAPLADNLSYYYFSDSYQFNWGDAAVELNKIESLCRTN